LLDIKGALLEDLAVRAMLTVVAGVSCHTDSECCRKMTSEETKPA
jgi:hypothetical protein